MDLKTEPLSQAQAKSRLASLDVPESVLLEAARAGQEAADGCTANDPTSLPGVLWWAKGIRTLRELLIPRGWTRADHENYPTVVHPTELLAIAVVGGTHQTGRASVHPTTARKKGPATRRAVERNQMAFTSDDHPAFEWPPTSDPALPTWLLLHYTDEASEEIRTELSLPSAYEDGYVTGWAERIILQPISLQAEADSGREPDSAIDTGDIDIDVARR